MKPRRAKDPRSRGVTGGLTLLQQQRRKWIEVRSACGGAEQRRRRSSSGAPLAEEGDGGEDGEREQVTVDAEDHLAHAGVEEDGLGDQDVVAAAG